MTRKLKHRQIARDANVAGEALEWIRDHASEIVLRANADSYDGYGPGTSGRAPGVSDPTAQAALAPRNRTLELAAGQFLDALHEAKRAAQRAERLAMSILFTAERVTYRAEASASGVCANLSCQVAVLNTRADRLREGRCEPCYRYRKDHGNERPRLLCHPDVGELVPNPQ